MFRAKRRIVHAFPDGPTFTPKSINGLAILGALKVHMPLANVAFDAVRVSSDRGAFDADDRD